MNILYAILAALSLSILLLLCVKIRLGFDYCKNYGEKLETSATAYIMGIPVKFNKNERKKKEHPKTESPKSNDEKLTEKIRASAETFAILKKTYSKNRHLIQKRVIVENAEIYIKFGLGDAAATGIATGALWAVLYQALAFVSCIGTVKKHKFEVVPVYDNTGFCSSGKGIISFRLINIIVVMLRLFFTYKSVKKSYE